jgi:hypothetical protein
MHEHGLNFDEWIKREEKAPAEVTFNYWLFFGPTQNSPIGLAQLQLTDINAKDYLPWWKQGIGLFSSKPLKWKTALWRLGAGIDGAALFDTRYQRSGRDKFLEVFREVNSRPEVVKVELELSDSFAVERPQWPEIFQEQHATKFVLKSFQRQKKNYQDYLENLPPEEAKHFLSSWKNLHKKLEVSLGDYPTIASRADLLKACPKFDPTLLVDLSGGILTFERGQDVLGFVHYQVGTHGVLFMEPFPLEPQGQEMVTDDMYLQYGLLKAHELDTIKKVMVWQKGGPMVIDQGQAKFFQQLGFQIQKILQASWCRTPYFA